MLVGAGLDNRTNIPEASYERLRLMRAEVVLALWTSGTRHRREHYARLWEIGVRHLVVRVGDEWVPGSVGDYLNDVDAAVAEAVAAGFDPANISVQILNETNLGDRAPDDVGRWVGNVVRGWRSKARPLLTPVSRGKDGWRAYQASFHAALGHLGAPVARACAVHAYAQDAFDLEHTAGKAMLVTEFSHPDLTGVARGLWVVQRLKQFAEKGYEAAVQFIVGGESHGAWPQGYVMSDEEARTIGNRGELPQSQPAPAPPNSTDFANLPAPPAESTQESSNVGRNPWRGKILTVWNLPERGALIDRCLEYGFDGVEIKVSDGDSRWGANRNVTREYVDGLRGAGLAVLGWSYNYCDGAVNAGDRGNGVPAGEARAALEAIRELGLDGWTADLEIECEGHAANVVELLATVKAQAGVPIAVHTWAYLTGHERYPVAAIAQFADVLRPMIYRPVWNAAETWREWAPIYRTFQGRVCPVWGITEATAAGLAADRGFAAQQGCPGEAFWEYSALPLPRDLEILVKQTMAADVELAAEIDAEAADLDAVWTAAQRFLGRGDPLSTRTGHALQAVVDSHKHHPAA